MNSFALKYTNPILLYDGVCGLCTRSVQLIIKYEAKREILFTPFQSQLGKYLFQQIGGSDSIDTVMLLQITNEGNWTHHIRSDVVIKIAPYLRFPWLLIGWIKVLPRGIRDMMYNLTAKYRYKIWGQLKACYLPKEYGTRRFLSQINDLLL
jgi:predicted DCC family thiol-disulfide oxidoreductase YuxK